MYNTLQLNWKLNGGPQPQPFAAGSQKAASRRSEEPAGNPAEKLGPDAVQTGRQTSAKPRGQNTKGRGAEKSKPPKIRAEEAEDGGSGRKKGKSGKAKLYGLRASSSTLKRDGTDGGGSVKVPRKRGPKPRPKTVPMSKYRRKTANLRERQRMGEINVAFERLREKLPSPINLGRGSAPSALSAPAARPDTPVGEGPEAAGKCEKLTKINILHIAINYIRALENLLETGDPGIRSFKEMTKNPIRDDKNRKMEVQKVLEALMKRADGNLNRKAPKPGNSPLSPLPFSSIRSSLTSSPSKLPDNKAGRKTNPRTADSPRFAGHLDASSMEASFAGRIGTDDTDMDLENGDEDSEGDNKEEDNNIFPEWSDLSSTLPSFASSLGSHHPLMSASQSPSSSALVSSLSSTSSATPRCLAQRSPSSSDVLPTSLQGTLPKVSFPASGNLGQLLCSLNQGEEEEEEDETGKYPPMPQPVHYTATMIHSTPDLRARPVDTSSMGGSPYSALIPSGSSGCRNDLSRALADDDTSCCDSGRGNSKNDNSHSSIGSAGLETSGSQAAGLADDLLLKDFTDFVEMVDVLNGMPDIEFIQDAFDILS